MVRLLHLLGHVEAPSGLESGIEEPEEQDDCGEEGDGFDLEGLLGQEASEADSRLAEREPGPKFLSKLHRYQKQALHWMAEREAGLNSDQSGKNRRKLHPLWTACQFPEDDEKFYCNTHTGELSLEFPHAAEPCQGGILADEMGLGKTVMMLALVASCEPPSKALLSSSSGLKPTGATLVVAPMSLLGHWAAECAAHIRSSQALRVVVHYGPNRTRSSAQLREADLVITTYGVLASEAAGHDELPGSGPLLQLEWWRVLLDEGHNIKNAGSNNAKAACKLAARARWVVTGTPIQNQLDDLFSLIKFLQVEPYNHFAWWTKTIGRPFQEPDTHTQALDTLRGVLLPLLLRRSKTTLGEDGKPIVQLPSRQVDIVRLQPSSHEADFYQALHQRSKTKFDTYVATGKVLSNYATVLELLLRLRQACDHPFLTMSRSDTSKYLDLDKLLSCFINKTEAAPTAGFVNEVHAQINQAEAQECPICLELCEDPVLTPCAHTMCRECLLASMHQSKLGAACPVCRQPMTSDQILTMPSKSRFTVDVKAKWQSSCKVDALLKELSQLPAGCKCVIFSQFTAFLDLLKVPLEESGIKFVRLDGSLSQAQREQVLAQFNSDPKAGGVGLNLVAANYVYMMDPWWNPAVELQALNRVHRIGQEKKVYVKRFIVEDTVEENMLLIQDKKQTLVSGALATSKDEQRQEKIGDLKLLFASKSKPQAGA